MSLCLSIPAFLPSTSMAWASLTRGWGCRGGKKGVALALRVRERDGKAPSTVIREITTKCSQDDHKCNYCEINPQGAKVDGRTGLASDGAAHEGLSEEVIFTMAPRD